MILGSVGLILVIVGLACFCYDWRVKKPEKKPEKKPKEEKNWFPYFMTFGCLEGLGRRKTNEHREVVVDLPPSPVRYVENLSETENNAESPERPGFTVFDKSENGLVWPNKDDAREKIEVSSDEDNAISTRRGTPLVDTPPNE